MYFFGKPYVKVFYSKIDKLVHLRNKSKEEGKALFLEVQILIKQVSNYQIIILVLKNRLAASISNNNYQSTDVSLKINELVPDVKN